MTGVSKSDGHYWSWCDRCNDFLRGGIHGKREKSFQTIGKAENALIVHMARVHDELWRPKE